MNLNYPVFILAITLLSFFACKTQKTSADALKKKSSSFLLEQLQANQLDYEWFSAKASIKYSDSLHTQNFISSIRLRKDSIIWMTVKKMGIEGGRALITPDSILIINRLDKEYYPRDYGHLKRAYNLDLDFETLQALIVGNAIYSADDKAKSATEGKNHRLTTQSKTTRNTFLLDPVSYLLQEMLLEGLEGGRTVKMTYADYEQVEAHSISLERKAFIDSPETGKVNVSMAFSKVQINVVKTTPFVVNERYRKM